jgi:hypothetical protein
MRGMVRRRPAETLQRELAAYENMLHRTGPTWSSLVAAAGLKVHRFARPGASPVRGKARHTRGKRKPRRSGVFPRLSCCLEG